MLPSPHKVMDSLPSRVIANRVMDHMPNLLLLTAVTLRQHLQLEATLSSSSNSMGPRMVNQHKLAILLPSPPLMATPSQPRVMEPVVMTVLLLLLLQLPPSLTALSQVTLPSLPTLAMASSLLPLHHRVTILTANRLVTTKIATPSQQHMANNNLATRPSRQAMASSKVGTNSRPSSSHRLLLLTLLKLLVPMGSPQPTSMASKADHPVTSPTITIITDRMARVEVLVTLALSPQGTQGEGKTGALAGTVLTEVE